MYVNRIGVLRDHPDLYGVSVYFQGCDAQPKCFMCHNPETWVVDESFWYEREDVLKTIDEKLQLLLRSFPKVALSFLGGEPLAPWNREDLSFLSGFFKERYGERIVTVLFTWRTPKEIVKENLLEYIQHIDEFVFGRYMHAYRREGFPSSKNQLHLDRRTFERIVRILERREQHGSEVLVLKGIR